MGLPLPERGCSHRLPSLSCSASQPNQARRGVLFSPSFPPHFLSCLGNPPCPSAPGLLPGTGSPLPLVHCAFPRQEPTPVQWTATIQVNAASLLHQEAHTLLAHQRHTHAYFLGKETTPSCSIFASTSNQHAGSRCSLWQRLPSLKRRSRPKTRRVSISARLNWFKDTNAEKRSKQLYTRVPSRFSAFVSLQRIRVR
jgi:hypothetical protein